MMLQQRGSEWTLNHGVPLAMAKVQPVAQFLADIFRGLDGLEHGVFAEKTHKLGTVQVGTRQGSRHGRVGLESNGKLAAPNWLGRCAHLA